MKKIFTTAIIIFFAYAAQACYADYTYTNGCVGDTVFFTALDGFAAYTWDYGDTTSGNANISHDQNGYHVYTTPGDYYVTLFVNIGAEWDYRTNLVHIGTTCFKADFSSGCGGNLAVTFNDLSSGAHTYQYWDFGDTASGVDNYSGYVSPSHVYTAEGWYTVTYVIDNGITLDTIIKQIYVDPNCISVTISNFTAALNCVTDTVNIYTSYSANAVMVHWDFGDPASGAADSSSLLQGSHVFSAPGFYVVTLIYANGITTGTLTKGIQVIDCNVWPGDANSDGEVNGEDIFPLGIYNGITGSQRSAANQTWTGQSCASWSRSNFNWMYLQDLVDMRTGDCNGDGTINTQDVAVIQTNYGKHHTAHNNRSAMLYSTAADPALALSPATSTITAGGNIQVTVSLGTASTPAGNFYGGSFTLLFDPAKVDANALVNFSSAWLDSTGNSLITFYHEDYNAGRLELAFVKTNHVSAYGYGNIATITFHSKTGAAGAFNIGIDGNAKLFNTSMYSSSGGNQEVFMNMRLQGALASIANPNGINNVADVNAISIYPNPSKGQLFIQHSTSNDALQLEVFNSLGQKVFAKQLDVSLTTELVQLPPVADGLYLISIKSGAGEMIQSNRITILK